MALEQLFKSLPIEVMATVLSFDTNDSDRISKLLSCLIGVSNCNDKEQNVTKAPKYDGDEEAVFRALCLLHWNSLGEDARPRFFKSWKILYCVLEKWVHRQGFYSVLEAAPWGLLMRLRFVKGKFVGDLIWPCLEEASFQSIRVLDIHFNLEGLIAEIELCNEKYASHVICIDQRGEEETTTIAPVVIPDFPLNTTGSRALRFSKKSSFGGVIKNQPSWSRIWDPFSLTSPVELLQSLFARCGQINLDWIEGPRKCTNFQYSDEMPLIKPGLYSGVYEDMYGKFKREVIMIEYQQFQFIFPDYDDANKEIWEDIRTTVFNHPNQGESDHRFQMVQEALVREKCKKAVFVLGRKVTGDFHVPMNKTTFGALVSPVIGESNLPDRVTDRGGNGRNEYAVVRSWRGWGTLAHVMFTNPTWSDGTLVQVQDTDAIYEREQFGFFWERDLQATILSRMPEQDEFPWFA